MEPIERELAALRQEIEALKQGNERNPTYDRSALRALREREQALREQASRASMRSDDHRR